MLGRGASTRQSMSGPVNGGVGVGSAPVSPKRKGLWHDPELQRKIKGCHRRLVKAILASLAAVTSGAAAGGGSHHILIDVSQATVPPSAVALQALAESLRALFGLSCEVLTCTPKTQPSDFYRVQPSIGGGGSSSSSGSSSGFPAFSPPGNSSHGVSSSAPNGNAAWRSRSPQRSFRGEDDDDEDDDEDRMDDDDTHMDDERKRSRSMGDGGTVAPVALSERTRSEDEPLREYKHNGLPRVHTGEDEENDNNGGEDDSDPERRRHDMHARGHSESIASSSSSTGAGGVNGTALQATVVEERPPIIHPPPSTTSYPSPPSTSSSVSTYVAGSRIPTGPILFGAARSTSPPSSSFVSTVSQLSPPPQPSPQPSSLSYTPTPIGPAPSPSPLPTIHASSPPAAASSSLSASSSASVSSSFSTSGNSNNGVRIGLGLTGPSARGDDTGGASSIEMSSRGRAMSSAGPGASVSPRQASGGGARGRATVMAGGRSNDGSNPVSPLHSGGLSSGGRFTSVASSLDRARSALEKRLGLENPNSEPILASSASTALSASLIPPILRQRSVSSDPPHGSSVGHRGGGGSSSSSSGGGASFGIRKRGPIFSQIFIAHNLDLAPSHTQSVLLQAMRLRNIPIEGTLHDLPRIHIVIATHSNGFVHPDLRIGRKLVILSLPGVSLPVLIVMFLGHQCDEFLLELLAEPFFFPLFEQYKQVLPASPMDWKGFLRELDRPVFVSPLIRQYARDMAIAVRQHARVAFGPSPQGCRALMQISRMASVFAGSEFVRPKDVDESAVDALSHRIMLRQLNNAAPHPHSARNIIHHLVTKVLNPPK